MKLFLDSADPKEIAALAATGLVDGVTTNPSLAAKTGQKLFDALRAICDLVPGSVSAEVTAIETGRMIAEGKRLAKIADNITIKVPLTWDGLKACKALSADGHKVNVTLCFSPNQALLAAKAGADLHLALHRPAGRCRPGRHAAHPRNPPDLRQLRLFDRNPRRLDPPRDCMCATPRWRAPMSRRCRPRSSASSSRTPDRQGAWPPSSKTGRRPARPFSE